MTPAEKAEIRSKNAQSAVALIGAGVLDPSEERERLARDPESGYQGLDVDAEIVPPNNPEAEQDPTQEGDPETIERQRLDLKTAARLVAQDSDFKEDDHSRDKDGKFGSGGGSGKTKTKSETKSKAEVSPSFMEFAKKSKSKITPTKSPSGSLVEIKADVKEGLYEGLMQEVDKMHAAAKGSEKEKAANYIKRAIEVGSEDKKYNVSVQLNQKGDIVGAVSMHPISDSIRIEHLGSVGDGAGKSCLKSAIQQSIKSGKEGAITLTPIGSAISRYDSLGFMEKQGSSYGELWLSPEAAKKLIKGEKK